MVAPEDFRQLPSDERLPIDSLARAFKNTTATYKFFWLSAILNLLHHQNYKIHSLPLSHILTDMLVLAWTPAQYFRLSFGASDKTTDVFEQIGCLSGGSIRPESIRSQIEAADVMNLRTDLLRWVPQRFLSAWFENELKGMRDQHRNQAIAELSKKTFSSKKPLYRLEENDIFMHPEWMSYLRRNQAFLQGWAKWNLLEFLQARNVSIPNIGGKLELPTTRGSLTALSKLWEGLAEIEAIHCPFSGKRLVGRDFTLDHYIPWSYVAHDEPWILAPVAKSPSVNSMKSDSLPHNAYLSNFISLQERFLASNLDKPKIISSYQAALRLSKDELLQPRIFKKQLEKEITALLAGANRLGFQANWKYSSPTTSQKVPQAHVSSAHAPSYVAQSRS